MFDNKRFLVICNFVNDGGQSLISVKLGILYCSHQPFSCDNYLGLSFQPEWYFTQALSWIRDHSDFLEKRVQPVLVEAGWNSVDARVSRFNEGLISLKFFFQ